MDCERFFSTEQAINIRLKFGLISPGDQRKIDKHLEVEHNITRPPSISELAPGSDYPKQNILHQAALIKGLIYLDSIDLQG